MINEGIRVLLKLLLLLEINDETGNTILKILKLFEIVFVVLWY